MVFCNAGMPYRRINGTEEEMWGKAGGAEEMRYSQRKVRLVRIVHSVRPKGGP